MAILQLNPQIPLSTPKGNGWAFLVIDYSQEHDLLFVVADDATGEIWTWPNSQVRVRKNISLGRRDQSPIEESPALEKKR